MNTEDSFGGVRDYPPIRAEGASQHCSVACSARKDRSSAARPPRFALHSDQTGLPTPARIENISRDVPLWLCAYLHRLPLEVFDLANTDSAAAVVEERQGRPLLHAVSPKAVEQGLVPGMPLSAAYALCPTLRIESRSLERERCALSELAEQGLAFTPWVSLDFSQALLLEVRGSLGMFGGLGALTAKLEETLSARGHRVCCAATPAPFASWLLARSGREKKALHREELRSVLGGLPSVALGIDAHIHGRLQQAGISSLRDLWRLPRDGLVRRYGTRLLSLLDQAAGYRATPLRHFHLPPRFNGTVELPEETERLSHFFPAIELLIARLTEFLTERDAAVTQLRLNLTHRNGLQTCLRQGSRRPTRDRKHLMLLLRERLERMRLPAPVCAVELSSEIILPWTPVSADLFAEHTGDPAEWQQMLDHIQARLGSSAVQSLHARADHRPEHAGQRTASAGESNAAPAERPFWLLPQPRALSCQELKVILPEAERIESGWWDAEGIRRDYHMAIDRRGSRVWIYRDLRAPDRWYLHGLFG